MKSLEARASIMEDNTFWEEARDSSVMSAPSGTRDRSSNSASERRQPESKSCSSKAGQMRAERAAVADRPACSWADRAPIPPAEVPRLARRPSSLDNGEPARRPRASLMSESACSKTSGWSVCVGGGGGGERGWRGTVLQEWRMLVHPVQERRRVKAPWASSHLPMAWIRDNGLATILESRCSHHFRWPREA